MPSTVPATAPAPTFLPAEPRPRRSAGRRVAIWLGGAVALLGALVALAGGAVLALFGADGVVSTDRGALSTPTSALVSGTASIDTGGFVDDVDGVRLTIDARPDGGRPVFVGVGPAADVDRYLAGVAADEVTDIDAGPFDPSFDVRRDRRPGGAVAAPPAEQGFWVAAGSGDVDWKVRDGDYRVVVMNADGRRGVATRTRFAVDVPYVPGIATGVLVAGLLIAAGGITSVALGARRPRG